MTYPTKHKDAYDSIKLSEYGYQNLAECWYHAAYQNGHSPEWCLDVVYSNAVNRIYTSYGIHWNFTMNDFKNALKEIELQWDKRDLIDKVKITKEFGGSVETGSSVFAEKEGRTIARYLNEIDTYTTYSIVCAGNPFNTTPNCPICGDFENFYHNPDLHEAHDIKREMNSIGLKMEEKNDYLLVKKFPKPVFEAIKKDISLLRAIAGYRELIEDKEQNSFAKYHSMVENQWGEKKAEYRLVAKMWESQEFLLGDNKVIKAEKEIKQKWDNALLVHSLEKREYKEWLPFISLTEHRFGLSFFAERMRGLLEHSS